MTENWVTMPAAVTVLFPEGDRFVVRSPELKEGDQVVVEGNERLFPSMPVTPVPVDEAAQLSGARRAP